MAKGYIYILTNPSFPNYVKIGYADDVESRLEQLNRTECTPFAFRVYATYEVGGRLSDIPVHQIIDQLNPSLRSVDNIDGKIRTREFFAMAPEDAYDLLAMIAKINHLEDNLKLWKKTKEEGADERVAEKIEKLNQNRHHFKKIAFKSSLTGKTYKGLPNESGTLKIIDAETGEEIPNHAKPTKKEIIGEAIRDFGVEPVANLYPRYHQLSKLVLGKESKKPGESPKIQE